MTLPRIILSCEDRFSEFAKPVLKAWKKQFPEILVDISVVTQDEELIKRIKTYGFDGVLWFKPVDKFPLPNLAKLARHYHAGLIHRVTGNNEMVMLEDIDTAPLQQDFLLNLFNKMQEGKILAVGHEVYKDMCPGKFPISNICSDSKTYEGLLYPKEIGWSDWVRYLDQLKPRDGKERPSNDPHHFSDESVINLLLSEHDQGEKLKKVERGVDIYNDWIDRSWWGINEEKLHKGKYVLVNFLRPCLVNFDKMKPVFDFIYGHDTVVEDLYLDVTRG